MLERRLIEKLCLFQKHRDSNHDLGINDLAISMRTLTFF